MRRRFGHCRGQVLIEYILLTVMVVGATALVIGFIVKGVFRDSMEDLSKKTTQCVSRLSGARCK